MSKKLSEQSLEQLYEKHKGKVSDKWSIYLREYGRIFQPFRHMPVRLLEIGIQNGGSLEIWLKFFKDAQKIIGCDINPDCVRLTYTDPRISVVVGDANSDDSQAAVSRLSTSFDLIIDDGSHLSSDIVKSFGRYFPTLTDGGIFVVEDLHCSYWKQFEGGLFDPFSSMAFFKCLADVVSHEHWGVERSSSELVAGFFKKYDFRIDEDVFRHIHSIEFINSMCVIRKLQPEQNVLGPRFIAGSTEKVVPGHLGLHLTSATPLYQTDNGLSERSLLPEEELSLRLRELVECNSQVTSLEQAHDEDQKQIGLLQDRREFINELRAAIAAKDEHIGKLEILIHANAQSHADREQLLVSQVTSLGQAHDEDLEQIGLLQDRREFIGELRATVATSDEQIQKLEILIQTNAQGLADSEQLLVSLNQVVTSKQAEIDDLGRLLAAKDAQIANCDQAAAETAARISDLDRQRSEHESQVANFAQLVATHDGKIDVLSQAISNRDAEIEILNLSLDKFDAQNSALDERVSVRDRQNSALNETILERDRQISGLGQSVTDGHRKIDDLNRVSALLEDQIKNVHRVVAEGEGQIRDLAQSLAGRDLQIESLMQTGIALGDNNRSLERIAAERDGTIAKLTHAVAERDEHLGHLIQSLAENERAIGGLNRVKVDLEEQASALNARLDLQNNINSGLQQTGSDSNVRLALVEATIYSRNEQINSLNQELAVRNSENDLLTREIASQEARRLTSVLKKFFRF